MGDDTYLFEAGDDAGVVSTATDSEGNNTVQLTGGALKDMQLNGSDSAWLLRYTKDDSVQLNGSFKVQWGGRSHTLAEFAKAIADASKPDTSATARQQRAQRRQAIAKRQRHGSWCPWCCPSPRPPSAIPMPTTS